MKVMISQPMKGKTKEQILEERKHAVKLLKEQGHEVVDSIVKDIDVCAHVALFDLAKSLEIMSKCDGVCFIGDWRNARGCRIERSVAEEYGLWVLTV